MFVKFVDTELIIGDYTYCRVFRDVPSDITIEVTGTTFSLHKVRF